MTFFCTKSLKSFPVHTEWNVNPHCGLQGPRSPGTTPPVPTSSHAGCSSNTPSLFQPQVLCTGHSLYHESTSLYIPEFLPLIFYLHFICTVCLTQAHLISTHITIWSFLNWLAPILDEIATEQKSTKLGSVHRDLVRTQNMPRNLVRNTGCPEHFHCDSWGGKESLSFLVPLGYSIFTENSSYPKQAGGIAQG